MIVALDYGNRHLEYEVISFMPPSSVLSQFAKDKLAESGYRKFGKKIKLDGLWERAARGYVGNDKYWYEIEGGLFWIEPAHGTDASVATLTNNEREEMYFLMEKGWLRDYYVWRDGEDRSGSGTQDSASNNISLERPDNHHPKIDDAPLSVSRVQHASNVQPKRTEQPGKKHDAAKE